MTPEAQRIAIANACGHGDEWNLSFHGLFINPTGKELPDYLNSLDCMHEAEKILKGKQRFWYWNVQLPSVCKSDKKEFLDMQKTASATASQRGEAFLKALNLWKD